MIGNALLEHCDWQCYLDRYSDLKAAFGNDHALAERHWYRHGKTTRDCTCGNLQA